MEESQTKVKDQVKHVQMMIKKAKKTNKEFTSDFKNSRLSRYLNTVDKNLDSSLKARLKIDKSTMHKV